MHGGEESEECVYFSLIILAALPLKDTFLSNSSSVINPPQYGQRAEPVSGFVYLCDQGRCIYCKSSKHHKVKLGAIQVEEAT